VIAFVSLRRVLEDENHMADRLFNGFEYPGTTKTLRATGGRQLVNPMKQSEGYGEESLRRDLVSDVVFMSRCMTA
jgi:hypothetical protein